MHSINVEGGRYRVLLVGIGDDSEEKKGTFCKNISEIYNISFPLFKKVVDHCPTVLKKNLSLQKATALAKTLHSLGALVSVEEKRDSFAVSLECQGTDPRRIALESSHLKKTEGGTWHVIGRAKNLSEENLMDTWVLIQTFDHFEEILAFEEIPLPINPLPPGEASPFKVIFEGDLPVSRVSLAFKNSSGTPLSAIDKRIKREWTDVKLDITDVEREYVPRSFLPEEEKEKGPSMEVLKSFEEIFITSESVAMTERREGREDEVKRDVDDHPAAVSGDVPSEKILELEENRLGLPLELAGENESEAEKHENIFPETRFDVSIFEEATKLLEEISERTMKRAQAEPPSFSWIEDFRNSIETYYQTVGNLFPSWFEEQLRKKRFADSLHPLLTILAHARFNQKNRAEKALKNTHKVFELILRPDLSFEEIPPLEETPFFTEESWRTLFYRAIPKLHQVAKNVIEKKRWNPSELERVIRIIPHMSEKSSRMAIRWIHELVPETVEIDFANAPILIGESLYRVSSRLGVVDPHFDNYQGKDSIGQLKIQAFARTVYPRYPMKIEEPMTQVGMPEEEGGGYCLPTQPRCEGCLFASFCERLCIDFNPAEKGSGGGQ